MTVKKPEEPLPPLLCLLPLQLRNLPTANSGLEVDGVKARFHGSVEDGTVWESGLTGRIKPSLLLGPLPGQGRLQSFLFSGLQVKSVLLGITDDVFLLHLPLETAQGALQGFAIMYDYICQVFLPFLSGPFGRIQAT
jgi:hypothetical protein